MRIHLIAVGTRMPDWVTAGYEDYARRLPAEYTPRLVELAPGRRHKGADPARAVREEGERILQALPKDCRMVLLDERGRQGSTAELARDLQAWSMAGRDIALCIGGPDGVDETLRQRADSVWSLSRLTLPHPLVRIVVIEQMYRAWSVLAGHPYHRGG
jgi:23S rRNA (pseudouridine1915-N3)-methyltransferase